MLQSLDHSGGPGRIAPGWTFSGQLDNSALWSSVFFTFSWSTNNSKLMFLLVVISRMFDVQLTNLRLSSSSNWGLGRNISTNQSDQKPFRGIPFASSTYIENSLYTDRTQRIVLFPFKQKLRLHRNCEFKYLLVCRNLTVKFWHFHACRKYYCNSFKLLFLFLSLINYFSTQIFHCG